MNALLTKITARFATTLISSQLHADEITLVVSRDDLREMMLALRDEPDFLFEQLIDVCGIDYLHYGIAEWKTESATGTGFDRGRDAHDIQKANQGLEPHEITFPHPIDENNDMEPHATQNAYLGWDISKGPLPRFAVVYHLLSLTHNHRLRVRVFLNEHDLMIPTVIDVWPSADWFEREAFDLFGMIFVAHPDLRRILTDYGFIGHPFRKDFPLIGNVEVRYDAALKRVIYEPVSIEPRILEPKVIRRDNRYESGE